MGSEGGRHVRDKKVEFKEVLKVLGVGGRFLIYSQANFHMKDKGISLRKGKETGEE